MDMSEQVAKDSTNQVITQQNKVLKICIVVLSLFVFFPIGIFLAIYFKLLNTKQAIELFTAIFITIFWLVKHWVSVNDIIIIICLFIVTVVYILTEKK
jgi:hypothetical protein